MSDLVNFLVQVSPEPIWKQLLLSSIPTEIHIKRDFNNKDLDFFLKHLVYKHARGSHVINRFKDGKIIARTYYLTKNFYIYEKSGCVRLEIRFKGKESIGSQLGITNFSDLMFFNFNNISCDFPIFKNTTFLNSFKCKKELSGRLHELLEGFNFQLCNAVFEPAGDETFKSLNCYHAQKKVFNILMNNKFKKDLEDHFTKIEFNLKNEFQNELEKFYKNFKGHWKIELNSLSPDNGEQMNSTENHDVFDDIDDDLNLIFGGEGDLEDDENESNTSTVSDYEMVESNQIQPSTFELEFNYLVTDKEKQFITAWVVKKYSQNRIAKELNMSKTTVQRYRDKLYERIQEANIQYNNFLIEDSGLSDQNALIDRIEMQQRLDQIIRLKSSPEELEKLKLKDAILLRDKNGETIKQMMQTMKDDLPIARFHKSFISLGL